MTEWIITSPVLIVIIAVLRFALRGKISLKLQYALWGLVLIRLLIPFSIFESPTSVLNILNEKEKPSTPPAVYEPYEPENTTPAIPDEDIFILDDNLENIKPNTNITIDDNGYVTEPEIRVISAKDILIPVWIGGMVVFGAVFTVSNLGFDRKLKKTREYVRDKKTWLPVYVTSEVKTPCLFGAIKPAIYVTEEVLKDEKTICHVIEHETTHYRHGDHVWSVLRCVCLAVHWYNPLVWLAAFLSMRDSELACDEDTIKRIGEEERIGYGRTLINLTCEKPAVGILSAATTMTGSKSNIKERIMLIAKKPKMLKITAAIVALIAAFAVGCTFTGAIKYNPKTTDEPAVETFSNRIDPELSGLDGTIKMVVTEASPKEITTEIFNETSEEIYYRISYSLYFEQNGKWYVLPKINEDNEFDFGTKIVESGKTGLWTSDIEEIYGKLPDGKYCINRTINFGDMDFVENEFYVIGAGFVLADGNFVDAGPIMNETEFVASELVYRHSASSFYGFSKIRYEIPEWQWKEFPYTDEEWKNLFFAPDTFPFPDISQYEEKYYYPLDSLSFIAYLDGELWSVYLSPKKPTTPDDLWVWDVYRVVPVEEVNNSEPELIADHISALNNFLIGKLGAEIVYEGIRWGTYLFNEMPENTDVVPDAVTFEKVYNGALSDGTYNGYYIDPFERMAFEVTNYTSKEEIYDYLEKYLSENLYKNDYAINRFFEIDGNLYYTDDGLPGKTYHNCEIVSQEEDRMVVSANVYNNYSQQWEGTAQIIFEKQDENWIITFFGSISNYEEEWAKEIYSSEIHSEYLKDIDEIIISHRDGTFEPMENHHSEYPADFPSLANVGYVPEEAVAIAWRNTIESGRTTYGGAVDYIVVIDKTHAIILEPAEFGYADGTVSYGFANTGYIDAEEWGYPSVYEWIKDTYTDYYSAAKMKSVLGMGIGTPLTQNELDRASKAFEAYYVEDGIAYANLLSVFLLSDYDIPEEMNAVPFLYYFPSGMLITDETEFEDLKKTWESYGKDFPKEAKIEDWPVPLHKIPKSMVNEALEKYMGITVEDLKYSDLDRLAENGIYYMEKYDCFYSTASDAHGGTFVFESGYKYSDGTVIFYGDNGSILTLNLHPDGSYKIYAYQR